MSANVNLAPLLLSPSRRLILCIHNISLLVGGGGSAAHHNIHYVHIDRGGTACGDGVIAEEQGVGSGGGILMGRAPAASAL
jgi:hypothetical protein